MTGLMEEDSSLTPAQTTELDRRLALYETGEMKAVDGEVALREIAEKHGLKLPGHTFTGASRSLLLPVC